MAAAGFCASTASCAGERVRFFLLGALLLCGATRVFPRDGFAFRWMLYAMATACFAGFPSRMSVAMFRERAASDAE